MLYFDSDDRALLDEVRRIRACPPEQLAAQLHPQLHPRGIQELCAHRAVRVAGAVATLLESLARAQAPTRLQALRVLREEALSGGNPALRRNTGRVLLQLMKELVRSGDDDLRQLELARDFRTALSGRPRLIRRLLAQYHLLEIPEDCAPASFDDHVHDASTKGRKTPSHLLLDAWIKGISELTVVYYNHLPPEAGRELLEAASILGIQARPAIEFPADFYGNIVNLIWLPSGIRTPRALANLLALPAVTELMRLGREVSDLRTAQLTHFLDILNIVLMPRLRADFSAELPDLVPPGLAHTVADGQPSLLHIAEYIHSLLQPLLRQRVQDTHPVPGTAEYANRRRWASFGPEELKAEYLKPLADRFALRRSLPPGIDELPLLLREGPGELANRLRACGCPFQLLLSTTHLQAWDIPALLALCRGSITGLEVFNLKDYLHRARYDTTRINELRLAVNRSDITALKRLMDALHEELRDSNPPYCARRLNELRQVRANIGNLLEEYAGRPLTAVIGSDSAGRSRHLYGMGLAAIDTLAPAARRRLRRTQETGRLILPVRCRLMLHTMTEPTSVLPAVARRPQPAAAPLPPAPKLPRTGAPGTPDAAPVTGSCCTRADGRKDAGRGIFSSVAAPRTHWLRRFARRTPAIQREWVVEDRAAALEQPGNLVTLGGLREGSAISDGIPGGPPDRLLAGLHWRWRNLNSRARNLIKVLAGFLPAFLTFYLTRDWWVLACGGALIWFGITGLRNIAQAVLAGGLHRSHLVRWRSLLDANRIADSLFFTGLSVPLLDLFVRNLLLANTLHLTAANHALVVFGVMSLINGLYISGHNYYRGLPKAAMIGNLFRSLLAIPLALAINAGLALLLNSAFAGAAAVNALALLSNCSAILTKLASDTIACVIEGFADRANHLARRREEWRQVLRSFFTAQEQVQLALPDTDARTVLLTGDPLALLRAHGHDRIAQALSAAVLDMLYFWFCQPRSRGAFLQAVRELSNEQCEELRAGLDLLRHESAISTLIVAGLTGRPHERALRFYRENHARFHAQLAQSEVLRAAPPVRQLSPPEAGEAPPVSGACAPVLPAIRCNGESPHTPPDF